MRRVSLRGVCLGGRDGAPLGHVNAESADDVSDFARLRPEAQTIVASARLGRDVNVEADDGELLAEVLVAHALLVNDD